MPTVPVAEMRKRVLNLMRGNTFSQNLPRNLRPVCRHLTADAYARSGEAKEADKQIGFFVNVAVSARFYAVRPLIALIRHEPTAGKKKLAEWLGDARQAAIGLHDQDRIRQDTASILAALLFSRDGLKKEARLLIERHADSGLTGQTSEILQRIRHFRNYDFHSALLNSALQDRRASQAVAVTMILAARGKWDRSLEWAKTQSSEVVKRECLLAWAEARAVDAAGRLPKRKTAAAVAVQAILSRIETAVDSLNSISRATLFARLSVRMFDPADSSRAAEWLAWAKKAAKSAPVMPERSVPAIKQLFGYQLLPPEHIEEIRVSAVAFAEIARAENRLGMQKAEFGWTSLSRALSYARALAPSRLGMEHLLDQTATRNVADLRERLRTTFNLLTRKKVDEKLKDYKGICKRILVESNERFEMQSRLLEWAAEWGSLQLVALIWKEVDSRLDPMQDLTDREPYFSSRVPWMLAARFETVKDAAADGTAQAIRQRIEQSSQFPPLVQSQLDKAEKLIQNGEYAQAGLAFNSSRRAILRRRQLVLALACDLVKSRGIQAAYEFTSALSQQTYPILKMEAFDLIASLATQRGKANDVWNVIMKEGNFRNPADKVAFCHGFIVALPQNPVSPEGKSSQKKQP
ncbi:MAG: hypothetical protein IID45_14690 [Planctomycetes bacterium]|nr:hypothetical protein [Planctomycetota bacterium]